MRGRRRNSTRDSYRAPHRRHELLEGSQSNIVRVKTILFLPGVDGGFLSLPNCIVDSPTGHNRKVPENQFFQLQICHGIIERTVKICKSSAKSFIRRITHRHLPLETSLHRDFVMSSRVSLLERPRLPSPPIPAVWESVIIPPSEEP